MKSQLGRLRPPARRQRKAAPRASGAGTGSRNPREARHALNTQRVSDRDELTRQRDAYYKELHDSRQRLRELAAHLEAVREEERRSIAAALHDELGQILTSVRLELSGAVDAYRQMTASASTDDRSRADGPPPDPEPLEGPGRPEPVQGRERGARRSANPASQSNDVIDRLQATAGLVDLAVGCVRRISSDLRPPILDQLGLIAALRWEAALFEKRTGIRCRVSARRRHIELPTEHVMTLYRILREALTNVARHAKAGAVSITVHASNGVVLLSVRDNGVGIREEDVRNPAALGILGMRERALAIGGDLRIMRARRRGTEVEVILPVQQPQRPPATPAARRGRRVKNERGTQR